MARRRRTRLAVKPTNPKDLIGITKLPLGLVPATMLIWATLGNLEGGVKYGRYNWRVAGVRASIYYDAALRHLLKWWNGQNKDPKTRIPHLANLLCCIAIILDAELYGKLTDDRPPCPNPDAIAALIDGLVPDIAHVKALFSAHNPHQWTIKDRVDRRAERRANVGERARPRRPNRLDRRRRGRLAA